MAERPPINPFANLRPDPTAAALAVSSQKQLNALRQGLATQQMKDAAAMSRNKANNINNLMKSGIQYNLPGLASKGIVGPSAVKTLGTRNINNQMKTRSDIFDKLYGIGALSPVLPGDSPESYLLRRGGRLGVTVPKQQAAAAAGKESTKTKVIVDDPTGKAKGGLMEVDASSSSSPRLGPPKITFPTSRKAPPSKKTQQSSDKKTIRKWGKHKDGRSGTWELNPATGGWKFIG